MFLLVRFYWCACLFICLLTCRIPWSYRVVCGLVWIGETFHILTIADILTQQKQCSGGAAVVLMLWCPCHCLEKIAEDFHDGFFSISETRSCFHGWLSHLAHKWGWHVSQNVSHGQGWLQHLPILFCHTWLLLSEFTAFLQPHGYGLCLVLCMKIEESLAGVPSVGLSSNTLGLVWLDAHECWNSDESVAACPALCFRSSIACCTCWNSSSTLKWEATLIHAGVHQYWEFYWGQ